MNVGEVRTARRAPGLILVLLGLTLASLLGATTASAAVPPKTDVMIIFDTSGSMGSELEEAKSGILEVIGHLEATLPETEFGVAEVRDYYESPYDPEEDSEETYPFKLDQPLTANKTKVKEAIEPLFASGGGDGPESYGRALWETATNPNVGWRSGARHIIILVADNVPHDHNLNEGLPEEFWTTNPETGIAKENPFNTNEELEGTWGIPGTVWTPGTDIEFHHDLQVLKEQEKPLEMVDFEGEETGFIPYWELWAAESGGQATPAEIGKDELSAKLTGLVEGGAAGTFVPCPTGKVRGPDGVCAVPPHPTSTQVICNLEIATATDTCTATVGDAATTGALVPTGTVSFASTSGGTFSAGSSCALVATPLSSNTASCSVTFVPPSTGGTGPDITATYSGDAKHASSTGSTKYPPADELVKDIDLALAGTIHGADVTVPITCDFPCVVSGQLFSGPSLASIASVSLETASSARSHKKKPKLLGKGSVKLSTAGKGKLIIEISSKYRHTLDRIKGKVHLTIKYTIKTLGGTLVAQKTAHITLSLAKTKKH